MFGDPSFYGSSDLSVGNKVAALTIYLIDNVSGVLFWDFIFRSREKWLRVLMGLYPTFTELSAFQLKIKIS